MNFIKRTFLLVWMIYPAFLGGMATFNTATESKEILLRAPKNLSLEEIIDLAKPSYLGKEDFLLLTDCQQALPILNSIVIGQL